MWLFCFYMTKQNRKPYFVVFLKLDYTQKNFFSGHFFIKEKNWPLRLFTFLSQIFLLYFSKFWSLFQPLVDCIQIWDIYIVWILYHLSGFLLLIVDFFNRRLDWRVSCLQSRLLLDYEPLFFYLHGLFDLRIITYRVSDTVDYLSVLESVDCDKAVRNLCETALDISMFLMLS